MTPYIGNGPYCYANATAMLLAASVEAAKDGSAGGETVAPGVIECLTGVGIGARWLGGSREIYFSIVPPDIGVARAFKLLGIDVVEEEGADRGDGGPPFARLRARLAEGPVMIGPLDMGHLPYFPNHRALTGADHYVLVTAMDDAGVRLHDPYGYPNLHLAFADLGPAWEARAVAYRRAPYRSWTRPLQRARPALDTLRRGAMRAYRETVTAMDPPSGAVRAGPAAFAAAAEYLRGADGAALLGLLTGFGLPLGARRAHDMALFLAPADAALAAIKRRQSEAFIDGYRVAVADDRAAVAESILAIGALDSAFAERLRAP